MSGLLAAQTHKSKQIHPIPIRQINAGRQYLDRKTELGLYLTG